MLIDVESALAEVGREVGMRRIAVAIGDRRAIWVGELLADLLLFSVLPCWI